MENNKNAKGANNNNFSKLNRRRNNALNRPRPYLNEKPTILIVCEGKNTEPSYFKQFRLQSATIKGTGFNTISLVKEAIKLKQESHYDQVWCVFDKDDNSDHLFNSAIYLAENNNIKIAYSNQAFEYWLILHFDDHQGGSMPKEEYHNRINKILKPFGLSYNGKKSKLISEDFFNLLNSTDPKLQEKRIYLAIKRAKRNLSKHSHTTPAKAESSTTIFNLVEEILKHANNFII